MIFDLLESMGLESDAALKRMANAESLVVAWNTSEVPSDMAWLLFRTTLDARRRTGVALAALTAIAESVKAQPFAHQATGLAFKTYCNAPPDAMKKLVSIHTSIMVDANASGLVKVLEPEEEGAECKLLFDETGYPHMIAWQVLRACLHLTSEEDPEQTAEVARIGFCMIDDGPTANQVCSFFREGLDFGEIVTAWEVWNSAATVHAGRA